MEHPDCCPYCASLRNWHAHGHLRRDRLCENLHWKWKCRGSRPGQAFCASLRSRNAHGHLQRNCFCENAPDQDRDNHFVGPDLPPAFTPTVRTPSVDTLFGDISETMSWHAFFDQSRKQPKQCWRCMNMISSNDTIRIPKVSMSARYRSICHAQKTPWNTILT